MKIEVDNCYNMDCYEGMCLMQAQGLTADWCISDPPYGIDVVRQFSRRSGKKATTSRAKCREYNDKAWDNQRIDKRYFDKMREVSRDQIIWGGGITPTAYL